MIPTDVGDHRSCRLCSWRLGVTGSTGAEGNWEGSGSMAWGLLGRHWELRGHGGYWEHWEYWGRETAQSQHWGGTGRELGQGHSPVPSLGGTGSTGAGRQPSPITGGYWEGTGAWTQPSPSTGSVGGQFPGPPKAAISPQLSSGAS